MVKQYIQLAILLAFSWNIYSRCQHETILPMIAGLILAVSFLMRINSAEKQFKLFDHVPLFAIILISLVAGYFYRSAFPLPEETIAPFPEFTAAMQSATIIAVIFLWLKPFNQNNFYLILFMAWLTVTLSINVPYSRSLFLNFSVFSLLSIVVIILNTSNRPDKRKYMLRYYLNFTFFSIILVAMTIVMFFIVSNTVMVLDKAFMNVMKDYIVPRHYTHFLNINPNLALTNPGYSAADKRPVLEMTFPGRFVYLRTQVFRDFEGGIWKESEDLTFKPMTDGLQEGKTVSALTMFASLKDIVPAPAGVIGIEGPGEYEKDENHIVYGREERQSRILKFSVDEKLILPMDLTPAEFAQYTKLPADIEAKLKEISSSIVGNEINPVRKTILIQNFFNENFEYSLSVDFRGDNKGLISMIEERKPAYCTHFASAMALLLRAEGIPSRLLTGFLTDEVIDPRSNKFLARVRHAHAWVGAWLTVIDPATNKPINMWARFDPTPPSAVMAGPQQKVFFDADRLAEQLWLSMLRYSAHVQSLDKEKVKRNVLLFLIAFMLLMNAKNIFLGLKRWIGKDKLKQKTIKPPARLQAVYKRYEQYLKKTFGETRQLTETDYDVVDRLKERPEIPKESIAKVKSFLKHYHAARFGEKNESDLERISTSLH